MRTMRTVSRPLSGPVVRRVLGGMVAVGCVVELSALTTKRHPTVSEFLRYSAFAAGCVAGFLACEWVRGLD